MQWLQNTPLCLSRAPTPRRRGRPGCTGLLFLVAPSSAGKTRVSLLLVPWWSKGCPGDIPGVITQHNAEEKWAIQYNTSHLMTITIIVCHHVRVYTVEKGQFQSLGGDRGVISCFKSAGVEWTRKVPLHSAGPRGNSFRSEDVPADW